VTEYRTKPLERALLRAELQFACDVLSESKVNEVMVSFGWDSNLRVEEMWQERSVAVGEVTAAVDASEGSGISQVGRSDIFVKSAGLLFTLCHEGDIHVKGDSVVVEQFVRRWEALGYVPYQVRQRA
jgi:hypothetical protein